MVSGRTVRTILLVVLTGVTLGLDAAGDVPLWFITTLSLVIVFLFLLSLVQEHRKVSPRGTRIK